MTGNVLHHPTAVAPAATDQVTGLGALAAEGLALADADGVLLAANAAFGRLLARSEQDMPGSDVAASLRHDQLRTLLAGAGDDAEAEEITIAGPAGRILKLSAVSATSIGVGLVALRLRDGGIEHRASTRLRSIEAAVVRRIALDTAAAELGYEALRGRTLSSLLTIATQVIANELGAARTRVLALDTSTATFELLIQAGWDDDDEASRPLEPARSVVADPLAFVEPRVIDDLAESAAPGAASLAEAGIVSMASIAIPGRHAPRGFLEVFSDRHRGLSVDDVAFLERIAGVLASAAERESADGELGRAEEKERRRIGEEIHDDPLQVMVAAAMRLEMVTADEHLDHETRADLDAVVESVRQACDRLRMLIFDLHPGDLGRIGLQEALRSALAKAADDAGFRFRLDWKLDRPVPESSRVTVFRVAQEAIVNIRKHARAGLVTVDARPSFDGILIHITDDGIGFRPESLERPAAGHLGVGSMQERAERAGGWCRIESRPGEGTAVSFWVPADPGGRDVT